MTLKSTPSNDGVRRVNMQIGFRLSLDDLAHAAALSNEMNLSEVDHWGKAKMWRVTRDSLREHGLTVIWGDDEDDDYAVKWQAAHARIVNLKLVQWEPIGVSARRGEMRTVK